MRLRHGSSRGLGIGLVAFAGGDDLYSTAIDLNPHAIVSHCSCCSGVSIERMHAQNALGARRLH